MRYFMRHEGIKNLIKIDLRGMIGDINSVCD